ncbi:MAG: hypothetical protein HY263_10230, partial [Chloroflexi bacterium]|nr:hypothetical protein [Chloroflexota bacterium]
AAGNVAISVAITATNHLHDTATKHYYFRTAFLAVLPNTSGFKLKAASGSPSVSVSKRTATYTVLKLDFGSNLGAGATRTFTLTFVLKDPGGAPDRPIRISPSLVSFYAWAFATPSTPGSSVTITFPSGYETTIGRGPLTGPTTGIDGTLTWTSGPLADPLAFVADVTADHPSDYVDVARSVAIGSQEASLVIRAWPDDTPWRTRVGDLVVRALPVLSEEIGLPWPIPEPLVVQEALVRSTGGYAGLFDPAQHRIEIAYAAPSGVVLHEAAHAWFNGALVADRWAAEAFASYYAEVAAARLKVAIVSPELTATTRTAPIPLNAWGAIGSASADTETYAYAASLEVARAIAARAGSDGLQRVWGLAASHLGAYQPSAGPGETVNAAPDWRGLLDLLEDATGRSYLDLWRTWVVRTEDLPVLDARAEAREAYARGVQDAGGWLLPRSIRDAMRAWQFGVAEQQLTDAEAVLRQRTALERASAAASLQLPVALRHAFESGDLTGASAEAAAELAALGAIGEATAAQPRTTTPLEEIGLIGASPDEALRASRSAFAAGDLDTATRTATEAKTAWTTAAVVGRGRVISAIGLVIALLLLIGLFLGAWRRRSAARANRLHSRP